jgi:hypothetical protein
MKTIVLFKLASFAGLILGALLAVGTRYRVKFLVDPPEALSPFYSQSFLKKVLGKDFLIPFNYCVATAISIMAVIFLLIAYIAPDSIIGPTLSGNK